MSGLINLSYVVNAIVFSFLGVFIFLGFLSLDRQVDALLVVEGDHRRTQHCTGDCRGSCVAGHLHHHRRLNSCVNSVMRET